MEMTEEDCWTIDRHGDLTLQLNIVVPQVTKCFSYGSGSNMPFWIQMRKIDAAQQRGGQSCRREIRLPVPSVLSMHCQWLTNEMNLDLSTIKCATSQKFEERFKSWCSCCPEIVCSRDHRDHIREVVDRRPPFDNRH